MALGCGDVEGDGEIVLPIARQNANHFVPLLPDLEILDEPDARMSKQTPTPPIIADAAIVDLKDALHKQGIRIDLEASRALPPGELGPACTPVIQGVSPTPTRRMAAQQALVRVVALAALLARIVLAGRQVPGQVRPQTPH